MPCSKGRGPGRGKAKNRSTRDPSLPQPGRVAMPDQGTCSRKHFLRNQSAGNVGSAVRSQERAGSDARREVTRGPTLKLRLIPGVCTIMAHITINQYLQQVMFVGFRSMWSAGSSFFALLDFGVQMGTWSVSGRGLSVHCWLDGVSWLTSESLAAR